MMELLWLLLPVAAFSGWMAARRGMDKRERSSDDRAPVYFRGLNFLLNEQPDKAIDVFVKMLEVDNETVETHLALGNLFRRRGEVDRAIRIHQNLIARPTLTKDQRAQALLELGQDYMRAGLFDRAENLFKELGELNLYQEQALANLHVIYQQEKDWEECLSVARKLENLTGKSYRTECAHYYCELAEQARSKNDLAQVNTFLRKAQTSDADCVRATLLQGELDATRGACKTAVKTYKRVEHQDPAYIAEMLPPLIRCYRESGSRSELVDYLRHLSETHKSISPVLALIEFIQLDEGDSQAIKFLADFMQENPDLEGLERLIELNLKGGAGAEKETLQILKELVDKMLEDRPAYQCVRCGFSAKTLHWQCPGCKSWSSIKPMPTHTEEQHWDTQAKDRQKVLINSIEI
ncbi:MAG: lipopolysaccharide assembly protein LapB [Candidatus Sedimenticola sp. PURPLELP]